MCRSILVTVAMLLGLATVVQAAAAASPLPWRGVVEGMYGRPWDHAERQRILRFMARHDLNAYVHAPKDDLYQRTHWRAPYPEGQQREFAVEIRWARERGIEWVPNLSPALPLIPTPRAPEGLPSAPVCFSCSEDLEALLAKLEPFRAAGARTFMLSFDDVVKVLGDPRDVAAYGQGDEAYGRANGDLLTRLLLALRRRDAQARLLTVGADYNTTADTPYLRGLRATLHPDVEAMWTGPYVFARHVEPSDVQGYAAAIGRKPIVWENWVTNDAEGNIFGRPTLIHLGAYPRRPEVAREVRGFLLNPMNEADLNLLPFATAARYFADPGDYDRDQAFRAALGVYGGADRVREPLRAFAETVWQSRFDLTERAPAFEARAARHLDAYRAGAEHPAARVALDAELRLVESAPVTLGRELSLREFTVRAQPWLESARAGAHAGLAATALLAAERPHLELRAERSGFAGRVAPPDAAAAGEARAALAGAHAAFAARHAQTFGARGPLFDLPEPSIAPPNAMDAFVEAARALDSAWLPRAPQATSGVTLTLDGEPVTVAPDGGFRLAGAAVGRLLVATDRAGGRTAARVGSAGFGADRAVLRLRRGTVRADRRWRVRLRARCHGAPGSRCRGTLVLRALRGGARLAAARFDLPAGHARRVPARLVRSARRRVRRSGIVRARVTGTRGSAVAATIVSVRGPRRR